MRFHYKLACLLLTVFLSACGGGGGGENPATPIVWPVEYISQGGLIWTPSSSPDRYRQTTPPSAATYCTRTFNGVSGWRLPTQPELTSLAQSKLKLGSGGVWSSTKEPTATNQYWVNLNNTNGDAYIGTDSDYAYVLCVR